MARPAVETRLRMVSEARSDLGTERMRAMESVFGLLGSGLADGWVRPALLGLMALLSAGALAALTRRRSLL